VSRLLARARGSAPLKAKDLRVGVIAPPWLPVPPSTYGGIELMIDELVRGLRRVGCDVELFTTGDATAPVCRHSLHAHALGTSSAPFGEREHVERAYEQFAHVDLVHDHTMIGPLLRDDRSGAPIVTTVHGELGGVAEDVYRSALRPDMALVAISDAQRRAAPDVPVAAVIPHGIDVNAIEFGRGDGGYVLFLGRMRHEEGVHRAIAIARQGRTRILIACPMHEASEHRYFEEYVQPLLGIDAIYLGEVHREDKLRLLAGAAALMRAGNMEPFSVELLESLACGTPVIGPPIGATPEIIQHGITGLLGADDDMADLVRQAGELDRRACRASVEERFSASRMVRDYVDLYVQLVAQAS
jgi:glycosyltransferase involved in cell wall biosynthesis